MFKLIPHSSFLEELDTFLDVSINDSDVIMMFSHSSNRDFIIAIAFFLLLCIRQRLILRKLSHSVFNLIVNCIRVSVGIHRFRIMIARSRRKNIDLFSHLKIWWLNDRNNLSLRAYILLPRVSNPPHLYGNPSLWSFFLEVFLFSSWRS